MKGCAEEGEEVLGTLAKLNAMGSPTAISGVPLNSPELTRVLAESLKALLFPEDPFSGAKEASEDIQHKEFGGIQDPPSKFFM